MNKGNYLLRCIFQTCFLFMISLVLSRQSLASSFIYENKNDDVILSSKYTIKEVQQTNLSDLNSDELILIIKPLSVIDKCNMRLSCSYFSNIIINFIGDEKNNWDGLQLLTGIGSMEYWEHIRIPFFYFPPFQRKNLLEVVTKDLVTINDGKWRGDILRKLLPLSPDEWDDALDCELAKKDIMYGLFKNQVTVIIPISIVGIILYPDSHHLLFHLILSGFSYPL